ncbi:MAG: thermonuclease family protein [Deltaproteobacteria bacterium]|nr:thermonuclease family protein [Deltaproteobacteria bacterium]
MTMKLLLLGILTALATGFLGSCTHVQSNLIGPAGVELATPCEHDKTTFRCVKYIRNYDADTITVEIPNIHPLLGENISVRVNGIDAPEMNGKNLCEKEAARTAQKLIESILKNAGRIDLNSVGRDKYFRVLADVSADGKLVKEILLNKELAYEYHGGTKPTIDWCRFTKP